MREEVTFQISNQFDTKTESAKSDFLKQELNQNKNSVLDLLNNFYFQERGKVGELNFETSDIKFIRELAGQVKIEFTVNYTNACADQQFNEQSRMTFDFEINLMNKILTLLCEEKLEREPDEF